MTVVGPYTVLPIPMDDDSCNTAIYGPGHQEESRHASYEGALGLATRLNRAYRHGQELQPRITTPCPACGRETLFVGAGGHLTCSVIGGCDNPSVASEVERLQAALVLALATLVACGRFSRPGGGLLIESPTLAGVVADLRKTLRISEPIDPLAGLNREAVS